DSGEAEGLAGRNLPTRKDSAVFAEHLRATGAAERVVIARGPDGSVMAEPDGLWHVSAADVPVRSKIGAGDSFVAGFALALARDLPASEALRYGGAAASAAVMTEGTQLCRREDAERLLADITLTPL
ncbi:MAG: PfkB family carbohydrate kinase, partial [Paracoccaceae bacterium]|nr:PfkB family carbohydrate kinase [Paracoccaceae bacterium]